MQQQKQIKEEILISKNLKMLTQAYQEHAIEQINFARYSVISAREFNMELEEIFADVKMSYRELLRKMREKKKQQGQEFTTEALVLITANNKLYGEIIPKICRRFYEAAQKSQADLIVIGKQGKHFVDRQGLQRQYKYFEIPDTNVSLDEIKPITNVLLTYDKVTVFHGKFNNMVSQEAVAAYVSGDMPDEAGASQEQDQKKKEGYIFEPTLETIVDFFERQIFSILLSQTVQEAQLARFGSRIKAMELAQENMRKALMELRFKEQRLHNIMINKKQLELFAGRSLWTRR